MECKSYFTLEEVSEITLYPVNSLYREISLGVIKKDKKGVSLDHVFKLLSRRVSLENEKRGERRNIWLLGKLEYNYSCLAMGSYLLDIGFKSISKEAICYLLQQDKIGYTENVLGWILDKESTTVNKLMKQSILKILKNYEMEQQIDLSNKVDKGPIHILVEKAAELLGTTTKKLHGCRRRKNNPLKIIKEEGCFYITLDELEGELSREINYFMKRVNEGYTESIGELNTLERNRRSLYSILQEEMQKRRATIS